MFASSILFNNFLQISKPRNSHLKLQFKVYNVSKIVEKDYTVLPLFQYCVLNIERNGCINIKSSIVSLNLCA